MIDFGKLAAILKDGLAEHSHGKTEGCFGQETVPCRRCHQESEVRLLFMRYYAKLREKADPLYEEKRREMFRDLLRSACEVSPRLAAMTDKKIAELLRDGVWSEADLFSPISDLLGSAIDRLERANGGEMRE